MRQIRLKPDPARNRIDPGMRNVHHHSDGTVAEAPRPLSRVARQGRLPLQDEWVFESTIAELAKIKPGPGTMVDLGAGPSRALEIFMSSTGCAYSAVDSHGQMVAARIRAGANPQRNHVAQMSDLSMFNDFHFDLAFSRATLGWIPDGGARRQALAEHIRVGWRSLILNFDWSTAAGGEAFNELRDAMAGVLEPMGFDPFYGAVQHAEVKAHARPGSKIQTTVIKSFSRRFRGVVLASAKGVLNSTGSRYVDTADDLILEAQREMEGGANFSLPAIVATQCY